MRLGYRKEEERKPADSLPLGEKGYVFAGCKELTLMLEYRASSEALGPESRMLSES